jgi:hypothetical protein
MSSILIEIIASLFDGAIPTDPPAREGELNASLGAIAAFLGFISLMFAIPTVVFSFGPAPFLLVLGLSLVVVVSAVLGRLAGRRALGVTRRNLALAKLGYGVSTFAMAASLVALLVALARLLL